MRGILSIVATPNPLRAPRHCAQIPEGASLKVVALAENPEEENSGIEVYYQLGEATLETCAKLDLLHQVINEPFFDVLRTKQQLGYVVDAGTRCTCGVAGFCFVIQTAKVSAAIAEARIEAFVQGFAETLDKMDQTQFEEHRRALATEKLEKDDSLSDEAWKHWHEITDGRYCFNKQEIEADAVKAVSHNSLIQWYKEHFLEEASGRRRLTIHVQSKHPPTGGSEPELEVALGPPKEIAADEVDAWRKAAFEHRNCYDISAEYGTKGLSPRGK